MPTYQRATEHATTESFDRSLLEVVEWREVESSNIEALAFVETERVAVWADPPVARGVGWLLVRFLNGGVYAYHDVHEIIYLILLAADSVGAALNRFVKGRYEYVAVPMK